MIIRLVAGVEGSVLTNIIIYASFRFFIGCSSQPTILICSTGAAAAAGWLAAAVVAAQAPSFCIDIPCSS